MTLILKVMTSQKYVILLEINQDYINFFLQVATRMLQKCIENLSYTFKDMTLYVYVSKRVLKLASENP